MGGKFLIVLIKNFKIVHLLFPKIPLLGIYPVELIGQVLRSVGTTMFISALEKTKMEMHILLLWYMHMIKILKSVK